MGVLVSINCITYNHENYISEAIESFLMQVTNFEYEILIGEDCSTDNTREIVDKFIIRYPEKIRLITSDFNVGFKENAKRLMVNSKGKYIADCEGDDYWTDPYKLQKQVDYMEQNPDCTLCFHAAGIIVDRNKKVKEIIKPYKESTVSMTEDIIIGGGGFCPTASLLYPRKLIKNLPDFCNKAHVGDYPLQMYLASKGYAYYINECMSVYRIGVKGSWTSNLHEKKDKVEKIIEVYEGDIQLLKGFNEYTESIYLNAIEQTVLKRELAILLLNRKLFQRQGANRQIYLAELGIKEWLKVYLHCYFPKPYKKLAEIKNFIFRRNAFN